MKSLSRTIAALAAVALLALGLAPASSAASGDPDPSFSLAISPTRLVVASGDVDTVQQIQVINGGTAPMHVEVQKQNFVAGRDGAVLIQRTAPYSASNWVTVTPTSFVVPAGGTQVVSATIALPAGPEPGDHQLALVFVVPAPDSTSNLRINRGIGMTALITVPGPIDDTTDLTALDAPGFVGGGGSVAVTATLHDTGTVHRDFRDQTPLVLGVDDDDHVSTFPDFTVMRGGTRDITTTWDPPFMCICHPTVSVTNADGVVQSKSVRVIVLPLLPLGIIIALLLLLALAYYLGRRSYRRSVIRAAAALPSPVGSRDP